MERFMKKKFDNSKRVFHDLCLQTALFYYKLAQVSTIETKVRQIREENRARAARCCVGDFQADSGLKFKFKL